MKAMITGASGTVGTVLTHYLKEQGIKTVAWNRQEVDIDDYAEMEAFLQREQPDVLYHLAVASRPSGRENESWWVNYHWTSELAWITRTLNIKFVFTSTVMVFSDEAQGPFTIHSRPDAAEGYGFEKLQAEERIWEQNPQATIARLGWQIGHEAGSNNMVDFLATQQAEHGRVEASTQWYPACSFLEDTAAALHALAHMPAGLYLINSNLRWTFYEIATALNEQHGRPWHIVPTEAFVYDQRMLDERVPIASLDKQLKTLA